MIEQNTTKEDSIFREFLQNNELRYTKEREEILQGILSMQGHFDTEELLIQLRKQNCKASLASIYRTIPLLIQSGLIEEVIKTEKHTRYEVKYGKEHHDHMICQRCGKLIEFYSDKLEQLQNEIAHSYDFMPVSHILEIKGYCFECQKA
ncbi:MAG TPA: Fur family transcriptional regulator [Thermodesulfovibrionia bacterium]|nr:Fur family transcriptional regulator [Thermodesulfovibrionia bacterium]